MGNRVSSQNGLSLQVSMGVYLSTPKIEKISADGENDRLRYGLSSMQGWRSSMEDAHAAHTDLDNSTSYFGVYDGHGGKEVAKFCAKYLHQQMLRHEAYLAGDLATSVRKAFLRMDAMMCGQRGQRELALFGGKMDHLGGIIDRSIQSPKSGEVNAPIDDWSSKGALPDYNGPSAGCTACVAVVRNNQLLVANAGDSRCVLSRRGQAHELSKDHKPDLDAEKERILNAGGYVQYGRVNGSLNLSRAIGDMELKQNKSLPAEKQIVTANPDITTVELSDDDEFLIIACDGIWDCMSSQEAVEFVQKHLTSENKLSKVCEKALDHCLAPSSGGEGCDNMTMILAQFRKCVDRKASTSSDQQTEPDHNAPGP